MPSFDSSVRGRGFAVRAMVGMALAAVILWRTNPTHLRHIAGLYPGRPAPRDRIDWSGLTPAERGVAERNHPQTSNTEYHDYFLFSATTDRGSGGLISVGILRLVFDLRSDAGNADVRAETVERMSPTDFTTGSNRAHSAGRR